MCITLGGKKFPPFLIYKGERILNLQETLKHYFGYDSLRPGQQELIDEILKGKDVLGIMPTGAGKSLCYQLPALMMGEKHSREKTLQLQED